MQYYYYLEDCLVMLDARVAVFCYAPLMDKEIGLDIN